MPLADLPANASTDFLKHMVTRGLIEEDMAVAVYREATARQRRINDLLIEKGVLTEHTAESILRMLYKPAEVSVIAGFQILAKLGEGATAKVYKALQLSIDREVALKVMSAQFTRHELGRQRFLREAQSAAQINHPNVVAVHDIGEEQGRLYIAMEYLPGGDARKVAKMYGGILPDKELLKIFRDCAEGLVAINKAGLIHRDIKPSNIFLDKDGRAKIADLGLACQELGEDRLTVTGGVIGTPAFMSPEQARAEEALDVRSDIYSLGASMFDLAIGHPPFEGPNAFVVVSKVINEEAPHPLDLREDMSRGLARIIARCMAHHRDDRYQSPEELLDAVEGLLSAHTQVFMTRQSGGHDRRFASGKARAVSARGRVVPDRRRQEERRRGFPLGRFLGLVVAMGIVALAVWHYGFREGPPPREKPVPTGRPPPVRRSVSTDRKEVPLWEEGEDQYGRFGLLRIGDRRQRFRLIPAGEFTMGAWPDEDVWRNDEIRHPVRLTGDFWLADTECSQGIWVEVMGENPAAFPSRKRSLPLPVESVSWDEVQVFLQTLEAKVPGLEVALPTEAQWEYAARGGTELRFVLGSLDDQAWHHLNITEEGGGKHPRAPGGRDPNGYGLYDMLGNVNEWVADAYAPYPITEHPVVDPATPEGINRVFRGGSWKRSPREARWAARNQAAPTGSANDLGFRILLVKPPPVAAPTPAPPAGDAPGTGAGDPPDPPAPAPATPPPAEDPPEPLAPVPPSP